MKVKFTAAYGLMIPKLQNRPMGVTLPLIDYTTGKVLPADEQILEVTENEGLDLIHQGHFVEVKEIIKKIKKEEVSLNG